MSVSKLIIIKGYRRIFNKGVRNNQYSTEQRYHICDTALTPKNTIEFKYWFHLKINSVNILQR